MMMTLMMMTMMMMMMMIMIMMIDNLIPNDTLFPNLSSGRSSSIDGYEDEDDNNTF